MTEDEKIIRPHTYIGQTTSICPECLELVNAKIAVRNNLVFFQKFCPQHGRSEALVSEDADYYIRAQNFARAGTLPKKFAAEVKHGCPSDCGLCPDHEQHCCQPIVEITDICNLDCPICIGDVQRRGHLSLDSFRDIVNNLVESETSVENITLI